MRQIFEEPELEQLPGGLEASVDTDGGGKRRKPFVDAVLCCSAESPVCCHRRRWILTASVGALSGARLVESAASAGLSFLSDAVTKITHDCRAHHIPLLAIAVTTQVSPGSEEHSRASP